MNLYKVGANVKKKYSSAEYHNLDIYQINTTYYSALGNDDKKYFIATTYYKCLRLVFRKSIM